MIKRYFNAAIVYAGLALAGGVFYREFTKYTLFTGKTNLAFIHTHYFMLGLFFFLALALLSLLPLALVPLLRGRLQRFRGRHPRRAVDAAFAASFVVAILASPLYADARRLQRHFAPVDAGSSSETSCSMRALMSSRIGRTASMPWPAGSARSQSS